MEQPVLFNHIPKTGGTTLRIILNKVYGEGKVFFIKSKSPAESLSAFKKLRSGNRKQYRVISGHGAEYFSADLNNPFRITILRDPIDLFLSQYYYLKVSPNSVFLEDVSQLKSVEAYIHYALKNGQDNLMTRFLSNSVDWLFDSTKEIPDLTREGTNLLEIAKKNLVDYDAVLNLANFDKGIFRLKEILDWKSLPLYRPSNKTDAKIKTPLPKKLKERLENLLRFDLELFQLFLDKELDAAYQANVQKLSFKLFHLRQKLINKLF